MISFMLMVVFGLNTSDVKVNSASALLRPVIAPLVALYDLAYVIFSLVIVL